MCMTSCSSRILSRNQKVIQTFISKNLTLIESLTFIVFASSNGLTKKKVERRVYCICFVCWLLHFFLSAITVTKISFYISIVVSNFDSYFLNL